MSAVITGINKLSLKRGVENNSTNVAAITAERLIINIAGDRINTIHDAERKKTADPSNDFLNNCVFYLHRAVIIIYTTTTNCTIIYYIKVA